MISKMTVHSLEDSLENKITTDLMKEYHQKIYIYCYNILRNPHDAEDAVQEVFFKAHQSNNLTTVANNGAWLYKIAYHHCLNQIRRKSLVKFISFTEKEINPIAKE